MERKGNEIGPARNVKAKKNLERNKKVENQRIVLKKSAQGFKMCSIPVNKQAMRGIGIHDWFKYFPNDNISFIILWLYLIQ